MKPETVSCMGGFCPQRDRCLVHLETSGAVAERLCPKGDERPLLLGFLDGTRNGQDVVRVVREEDVDNLCATSRAHAHFGSQA